MKRKSFRYSSEGNEMSACAKYFYSQHSSKRRLLYYKKGGGFLSFFSLTQRTKGNNSAESLSL